MDFVPTTMLASSTPVSASLPAATVPADAGFAALLSMMEQAAVGAAGPTSAKTEVEQSKAKPDTKGDLPAQFIGKNRRRTIPPHSQDPSKEPSTGMPSLTATFGRFVTSAIPVPAAIQDPAAESAALTTAPANPSATGVAVSPPQFPAEISSVSVVPASVPAPGDIFPVAQSSAPQVDAANEATEPAAPGNSSQAKAQNFPAASNMARSGNPRIVPNVAQPATLPTEPQATRGTPGLPQTPPNQTKPAVVTAPQTPDVARRSPSAEHSLTPKTAPPQAPTSQSTPSTPTSREVASTGTVSAGDPEIQQVIGTVTAMAAGQVAPNQSTHSNLKVPSIHLQATPIAATAPTNGVVVPQAPPTGSSGSTHNPTPHERGKQETKEVQSHSSEPSGPPVETPPKEISSSELTAVQTQVSSSSLQSSGAPQNPIVSNREVGPAVPPTLAGPAPAPSAQDLPHPGVLVNSASLLEQVGKSELRMGMRVGDFGSVEIRTQMDRQQLKAEISVEHHDLGRALTAELPSLQQKLHDRNVPLISLNLTGQGTAQPGSQHGYRNNSAVPAQLVAGISTERVETASSPEETDAKSGLDIRI